MQMLSGQLVPGTPAPHGLLTLPGAFQGSMLLVSSGFWLRPLFSSNDFHVIFMRAQQYFLSDPGPDDYGHYGWLTQPSG